MIKPLVSILVPCFNVERYVVQCLESLLCQTLQDIEVICLNDGSTDSTLEMIRSVIRNDSRFRIIDKPNSGYGATMNLGLSLAHGAYIGIVESDDYVEANMFEKLYRQAIEHNLDISRCCFNSVVEGSISPNPCKFLPKNQTFEPKQYPETFRNAPSIWTAIYRRDLIEKFNIKFLETPGAAFQDTSFAFKTMMVASAVRCLDESLLYYRIHGNNSVKKGGKIFEVIHEMDECLRFAKAKNCENLIQQVMLQLEYGTFKWNYNRLHKNEAHLFYKAWVERWILNNGYAINFSKNLKMYLIYKLITTFPKQFEKYLTRKSR